jgi:hypothetical protein
MKVCREIVFTIAYGVVGRNSLVECRLILKVHEENRHDGQSV